MWTLVVFVLFVAPDGGETVRQQWVAGRSFTQNECVQRGQYLIGAVSELDGAIGGGFVCEFAPVA